MMLRILFNSIVLSLLIPFGVLEHGAGSDPQQRIAEFPQDEIEKSPNDEADGPELIIFSAAGFDADDILASRRWTKGSATLGILCIESLASRPPPQSRAT